jgi:ABC-2 type transport system permease protein
MSVRDTVSDATTQRSAAFAPRSTAHSVWLVAEREIGSKLRSRPFVISSVILLLFALAGVVIGGIASQADSKPTVVVTSETAHVVQGRDDVKTRTVGTSADAIALVKKGDADVALVPRTLGDSPFDFVVVAKDTVPVAFVSTLSQGPPVELIEKNPQDGLLRYLVALGFGIVFLMAASLFGSTIAQSVVEEKQTRVVEILIAAIPVRALLAGKVVGNTILAMAQIVALVAIALIGLRITGQGEVLGGLGGPVAWFAVFFLFGFVLLASLFAGAGAMVSRQEDIGSTTAPLTMLIVAPYVLVIIFNDNPVVLTVLSYIPFSAPVAMPLRVYLGQVQWWEPELSLLLLIATCLGAIVLGARVYANSILRMGGRVHLREALS